MKVDSNIIFFNEKSRTQQFLIYTLVIAGPPRDAWEVATKIGNSRSGGGIDLPLSAHRAIPLCLFTKWAPRKDWVWTKCFEAKGSLKTPFRQSLGVLLGLTFSDSTTVKLLLRERRHASITLSKSIFSIKSQSGSK